MQGDGEVEAGSSCLMCRVHGRPCGFALQHVIEIMRPLPVVPLAGAPSFVLGVALIRGEPTPVVDACALFTDQAVGSAGRYLHLETGARRVALAVDAVIGVRRLPARLQELPPLLRAASPLLVSALGTLDAELLLVLQAARLVPDAVLQAIDQAEPA